MKVRFQVEFKWFGDEMLPIAVVGPPGTICVRCGEVVVAVYVYEVLIYCANGFTPSGAV